MTSLFRFHPHSRQPARAQTKDARSQRALLVAAALALCGCLDLDQARLDALAAQLDGGATDELLATAGTHAQPARAGSRGGAAGAPATAGKPATDDPSMNEGGSGSRPDDEHEVPAAGSSGAAQAGAAAAGTGAVDEGEPDAGMNGDDAAIPSGDASTDDPDAMVEPEPEPELCGNGALDDGEQCDTAITSGPNACPTSCGGDTCRPRSLQGSACGVHCVQLPGPGNVDGDGCCAAGATVNDDDDCCGDQQGTTTTAGANELVSSAVAMGDVTQRPFSATGRAQVANYAGSGLGCGASDATFDAVYALEPGVGGDVRMLLVNGGAQATVAVFDEPPAPAQSASAADALASAPELALDDHLHVLTASMSGFTVDRDPGLDACGADAGSADAFAVIELAQDASVEIDASGSAFAPVLGVYALDGDEIDASGPLACHDAQDDGDVASLALPAGRYALLVSGHGTPGALQLLIRDPAQASTGNLLACAPSGTGLRLEASAGTRYYAIVKSQESHTLLAASERCL